MMIPWNLIAENLTNRFGVELEVINTFDKRGSLRVVDIDAPDGFSIEIGIGWRSVDAFFRPDPFASNLLRTMGRSSSKQRGEFKAIADAFKHHGLKLRLNIDDTTVRPQDIPEGSFVNLELQCTLLSSNTGDQSVVLKAASACLALILSLLPIESVDPDLDQDNAGFVEGGQLRIETNKYERHPSNRAAAIAIHGAQCKVCHFDFEETYGEIGSGLIEVHHILPVSKMGGEYFVNPAKDLVPLCPNCHRMVHMTDPPLTVEALSKIMRR